MDQYYNNNQGDILWKLLANQANDASLHAAELQQLVNDFPQSGLLQAMFAHASEEKNLKKASVYFNPKSLYKLINSPSSFIGVLTEKIIVQNSLHNNDHHQGESIAEGGAFTAHQDDNTEPAFSENYFNEPQPENETGLHTETRHTENITEHVFNSNELEEHYLAENGHENENATEENETIELPEPGHAVISDIEPGVLDQIAEDLTATRAHSEELPISAIKENATEHPFSWDTAEHIAKHAISETKESSEPTAAHVTGNEVSNIEEQINEKEPSEGLDTLHHVEEQQPAGNIEDETFEEIAGIESFKDESVTPIAAETLVVHTEINSLPVETKTPGIDANETVVKHDSNNFTDETDKLIAGSIASSDYFMLNKTFDESKATEKAEDNKSSFTSDVIKVDNSLTNETEQQDVAKYNDEKMPYTFMWWLDKTRREHEGIYQPYTQPETSVSRTKVKKPADELQQQYYENIFHITSFDELSKKTYPKAPAARPDLKYKELEIIERFIQEEPQIRPQSSDKLDNENKAKKSSEDRDELVTETLASIYTDQMLYHKAIASYKKLILKFPEKSRYFADKIEQLEKKTN